MNTQQAKQQILSLSACSVPVMAAVVGWGTLTDAETDHFTPSIADAVRAYHFEEAAVPVYRDNMVQCDANWICMSPDDRYFWVSKGQGAEISTYRFTDSSGRYELVEEINELKSTYPLSDFSATAETANSWVDLNLSDDGQHLYQVFGESGAVGVYEVDGGRLTLIELLSA